MDNQPIATSSTPLQGRAYWVRYIAGALVAVAVALAVTFLWKAQGWPYASSVATGVLLFFIPIVSPPKPGAAPSSWTSRVMRGLMLGIFAGLIQAMIFPTP